MTSGQESLQLLYLTSGWVQIAVSLLTGIPVDFFFFYLLSIRKYFLQIYFVIIHGGHRRTSRLSLSLEVVHLDTSVRYVM